MKRRYKRTPLSYKIKSFFTKRNIKIILPVFLAAVLISAFTIYIFSDSKPVKDIKRIGFTVLAEKSEKEKTEITVATGSEEISEKDLILARYAKDFLDSSDYEGISIVFETNNGKDIVSVEQTDTDPELKTPLDLYMEEGLLRFKTEYDINAKTNGLLSLTVTDYPQCFTEERKEVPVGRTLNISVRSSKETIEKDIETMKEIFFELNSRGASVYVFNTVYVDGENNILKMISVNAENGNEIIIENHDNNK